jgi:hypothetical protein
MPVSGSLPGNVAKASLEEISTTVLKSASGIKEAFEAARNSTLWKDWFLELEINSKPVLHLRKEYEREQDIVYHVRRIEKGKK